MVLIVGLSFALSYLAYRFELLNLAGAIASLVVGLIVGFLGSIYWLLVLVAFTLMGFAATKAGFSKKKERGLQEGTKGERGAKNVLGVSIPAAIIALMYYYLQWDFTMMGIAYIATIAVASADTAASELGTRDPRVRLITNLKKVPPGTNGGISIFGTLASLVGALAASAIGWVIIFGFSELSLFFIPVLSGFVGCMLDSFFGVTLEDQGHISKYSNNALTGLLGGIIAMLLFQIV